MSSVTLAYETQLRIRREGEERIRAQQDLTSWLDELKLSSNTPDANLSRVKGTMVETTTPPIVANFEDERRRGNEFFSRGKYQEAIECYTRCLLDKDAAMSPVVYSNRGMYIHIYIFRQITSPFLIQSVIHFSHSISKAQELDQCRK